MPEKTNFTHPHKSTTFIQIAAIIGLLDSAYLSYIKLANASIYCTPGLGHCDVVNASRWSLMWGIPIAVFGVVGYATILLLVTFGNRSKTLAPYVDLMLFGISLTGFLFSLYLTLIEIFVLKTICQWCVLSALMMTAIFILSITRLVVQSSKFKKSGGN